MSACIDPGANERHVPAAIGLTLLDLVVEVQRRTRSDAETVETVYRLLESGRVRLCGSFRENVRRLPN
jgi:hypothetical protein